MVAQSFSTKTNTFIQKYDKAMTKGHTPYIGAERNTCP